MKLFLKVFIGETVRKFSIFNHQISIFGFQFVSQKFRRMIKDFYSISGI
jgi:hypothetical protein